METLASLKMRFVSNTAEVGLVLLIPTPETKQATTSVLLSRENVSKYVKRKCQ